MMARKQRGVGRTRDKIFPSKTFEGPSDLLPPTQPPFLKLPVTPSWEQRLQHMKLWGTVPIQTITGNSVLSYEFPCTYQKNNRAMSDQHSVCGKGDKVQGN
jgi:hypothetical protein